VGIFRGELRAGNGGGRARENSATNCAAGSIVDARESADRPLLRQDEQKAVPTKDRVRRDRALQESRQAAKSIRHPYKKRKVRRENSHPENRRVRHPRTQERTGRRPEAGATRKSSASC